MSFIMNLLWIILGGGFFIFLEYFIGGLLLCCTIIGIPFGIKCFKLSGLGLFPFGKKVIYKKNMVSFVSVIMNILWFIFGISIALTHLIFAFIMFITIIGIPFAKQHMKLVALGFAPFGKDIK